MRSDIIYQPTTRDYFPLRITFAFSCQQSGYEDHLNAGKIKKENYQRFKKDLFDFYSLID